MKNDNKLTRNQIKQGFLAEIKYQKRMLHNLGTWLSYSVALVGIGIVLLNYYSSKIWLGTLGGSLCIGIGVLAVLIIGYARYNGQKNLKVVIDKYHEQINQLK